MATCASNATDTSFSHDVFETSFGGYNCSFVQEPDQTLFCLICARVLREPQLTDCCGNHYCSSCLKRWLKNSPSCPLCREKNFSTLRDKKTERRVQELEVIFLKSSIVCSYAYFILASCFLILCIFYTSKHAKFRATNSINTPLVCFPDRSVAKRQSEPGKPASLY